jgi:hypothetical protein
MRFAVMAFIFGVVTLPSQAATINVAPGEVLLAPGNGKCSLREAILNVEKDTDLSGGDCPAGSAGADTISLAPGSTYSLPDRDPYPLEVLLNDREPNGLPEIRTQFTIDGNGATIERAVAAGCFRIFYVSIPGNLSLNNLTLQRGCANLTDAAGEHGAGGAIFNRGTLSLDTVTIASNFAFRSGGGIHNDGKLTVTRSTVRNNAVSGGSYPNYSGAGGGIVNRGSMQVFQSTISSNTTGGAGGAVDAGVVATGGAGDGSGKSTFANTTVSGNVSTGSGGGMFFGPAPLATVVNSTVTNNSSGGWGGGGIWVNYGGAITLTNSLVARQAASSDCWFLGHGTMTGSSNLDSDATCAGSTTVADPMIGPLANNGGPTLTHALLFGSPAINIANDAIATAFPVSAVDQRGVTRPQGASSDIGAFEVGAIATTTSVATSGTPSAFGGSVTFTATVTSSGASGSVSFYDGATLLGSGPVSGTTATFTTSALSVGGHSITAVYDADANYAPSTSAAITQTVNPLPTTTSVATSGTPSTYGTSVTFTATVTTGATGSIGFYDGATLLGAGAIAGTTATFTTSTLSVGGHSITAVYAGDGNYIGSTSAPITQTVDQVTTTTSVATSGSPSTYGTSVTFTATVTSGATGNVTFKDGALTLGISALSGTTAAFTTSALNIGGHSITAVYGGETNYSGSTSPAITQTVNQGPTTTSVATSGTPSVYGTAVTLTATVTSGATGTVTFYDGVTSLGTGTLSGNTATLTTSALTAGGHSITAVYEGDTNYLSSTSPVLTQTVNPASGGVTLGSSLNPSTYGNAVTFTASVAIDATGSITFMDGATTLGSGTIVTGSATFTTSSLGGGSHNITAVYAGDANHSPATSPILTQVVNRALTTTTFTSSAGPYFASLAVTFTATVTAGATGTVTFNDGATVLGTAALVNGTATFTTSALNAGPHSITASYSSDANFAPSVSAAAAILVGPASNIPTLSILMLMTLALLIVATGAMKVGR